MWGTQEQDRVERFDAVTADLGEIDTLTRLMFGASVRVERHDGQAPSLRLAQAGTASLAAQRVTWNVDGRCDVEPLGRFLCIRLRRGAYGLDQGDGRAAYAAGDTFLVDPRRRVDAEVLGADLDSYTIDLPVLEHVARQIAPWAGMRMDYGRPVPVTAPLARTWDRVLDEVTRTMDDDLIADNALIRASLVYRVVAAACAVFDLIPDRPSERTPSAASVRRAAAFIDDHLAEAITVGDIAAAAGLSDRGLQAAFHRDVGLAPLAYLRRERLRAARRDLQAGSSESVADVALRWGFSHLGRFAGSYRREFGELPRETLNG